MVAADAVPIPATIDNISAEGCLIVLQKPQFLSQDMVVELRFAINGLPVRVWGRVRAIRSETSIGFHFALLSDRIRRRIEDLIEQLIEDFITTNLVRGETEQRRFPRVACRGAARIQVEPGESFHPATLLNLSAGGCLILLHEPHPVAQNIEVDLDFQINHLACQVRGQAKAIHSITRVGFEFRFVNERTRRQIEDLVEGLIDNIVKRFAEPTELKEPRKSESVPVHIFAPTVENARLPPAQSFHESR
jgi:c-di-GMP-binding flagellar brake protein YcgR